MVQETAVEGYEFNPKKELRREYNLNYGSNTYERYHGIKPSHENKERISGYLSGVHKHHLDTKVAANKESEELSKMHPDMSYQNSQHLNRLTSESSFVNRVLIDGEVKHDTFHSPEEHAARVAEVTRHIEGATKELEHHAKPLERELHVYSGTSGGWNLGHLKEGDAVHTPAFTSTSITPRTAYTRATVNYNESPRKDTGIDYIKNILHFQLPKGYKGGAHIASVSEYPEEHEYLLNKDQKWRVKAITEHTKEVEHGSNHRVNPDTGRHELVPTKQRHRARFITLVPHEENQHVISEATYHDASMYRTTIVSPLAPQHKVERANIIHSRGMDAIFKTAKDADEQHERLKKTNSITNVSNDEAKHIGDYTTYASKYLNGALTGRMKADKEIKKLDEGMSNILKKHSKPLSEEVHAYSGLRDWLPPTAPGGVFHTPAYTSATLHADRARVFTASRPSPDPKYSSAVNEQHIIHFHLPKGYDKSVYIAPHSEHPAEKEIILHKGQSWKHISTEVHNNVHFSTNHSGQRRKRIIKTYIHTVTPHDSKTVTEQTEHTTVPFRQPKSVMDPKHYTDIHHVYDNLHTWTLRDAEEQHKRLLSHFGGEETGTPHDYENDSDAVTTYTRSGTAAKLNQTAVVKHLIQHGQKVPEYFNHRTPENYAKDEAFHKLDKDLEEKSVPLPEDVHVYSGTGAWDISNYKKGDVVHTPAYTSTSIHAKKAKSFTLGNVLHFHLPKGSTHGAYIAGYSHHAREKEFLLKRDQKWKVTDIKFHSGGYHVVSLAPHTENVQEVLVHDPDRVRDSLMGNSIRHTIDSKLTSMFITPHPDVEKDSLVGKSLSRYTMSSSGINNALIAGDKRYLAGHKKNKFSDVPQVYQHIKDTFANAKPLPFEHHLYSGLGHWDPLHKANAGIGDTLHTPAFTSTSHSLEIARRFAPGGNIIHFHLPKGYDKAINMRKFTSMKHESEVLLDHGQTWKIHGITHTKGVFGEPVRIVTVKPHTAEPITEMALRHDPKEFAAMYGSRKNATLAQQEKNQEITDAYEDTDGPVEQHVLQLEKHNQVKPKSKKHQSALEEYTEDSSHINRRLIDLAAGKPPHPHEHEPYAKGVIKHEFDYDGYERDPHYNAKRKYQVTQHLDEIMVKHSKPLKTDGHFYTGTGNWNPVSKLKKGDVVHTPSFISSSANPDQAMNFARKNHIIHFHLPKGSTHGVYIGGATEMDDEQEYLIGRNKKWKYAGTQTISTFSRWQNKYHRRKIHTFVPHGDESIKEAFEHNVNNPTFKNTTSYGIESFGKLKSDEEHKLLKTNANIPDEYKDAVHTYGYCSSGINHLLIRGTLKANGKLTKKYKSGGYDEHHNWIDSDNVDAHAALTELFDKHPSTLTREHHVYSGLGPKDPTLFMKKGVFTTPAYTSTSIRPSIAVKHTNTQRIDRQWVNDRSTEDHIIHFHLPKGYTGGKYIQGHTEYHEGEFLLRPKQKWKVVGKESINMTIGARSKRPHTRHIWTVVPHKENQFITEAFEHDPKRDLKREATIGKNPSWQFKHNKIVNARIRERGDRRFDEHVMLSGQHNFFDPHVHNYTDNSSHLTYHLLDPEASHADDIDELNHRANRISGAIKKHTSPLERDHHVYSGISYPMHVQEGDVIHSPAFTSTSIDINIARRFSSAFGPKQPRHILHFHLPKGYTKGVYLGGHCSHHQEEHEFLLDKDQKWKVHSIKEYHQGMHHNSGSGDENIRYNKYKVVTLKPHDDNIQEATFHTTVPFRRTDARKQDQYGGWKHHSTKFKNMQVFHEKVQAEIKHDADNQHDRLRTYFNETIPPRSFGEDRQKATHRTHLFNYTESSDHSRLLNNTAIHAHNFGEADLAEHHRTLLHDLDNAIEHTRRPLPEETHVYSGVKWEPKLNEGDTVHLPAYTSTSLNPNTSGGYAHDFNFKHDGNKSSREQHILHFHLPEGYDKGTYVGGISEFEGEKEYLLPRNTKWKVTKKKVSSQTTSYRYPEVEAHHNSHSRIRSFIYTLTPHHDDK